MAWIALIIAGLLETAWAPGLKSLSGGFRLSLLIATATFMFASLGAVYWSMRSLPLGTAYPIWAGIGSIGSVVVGIAVFKQEIGAVGIAGGEWAKLGGQAAIFETVSLPSRTAALVTATRCAPFGDHRMRLRLPIRVFPMSSTQPSARDDETASPFRYR